MQNSIFNMPGRIGWFLMEIAGPLNMIYNLSVSTSPSFSELPAANQLAAALYCIHYANRAVISPFFSAPSMSPMHLFVVSSAVLFNWFNSSCLVGWILGHDISIIGFATNGAETLQSSSSPSWVAALPFLGTALFAVGMVGNIYSETSLFRMRRYEVEQRSTKRSDSATPASTNGGNKYSKVYVIPPTQGIFRSILYPHYAFEWLEWTGFAIAGLAVYPLSAFSKHSSAAATAVSPPIMLAPWLIPFASVTDRFGLPLPLPAIVFLINAVANMLPHARWGRKWYVDKFGEKKVAGRGAVVPWCPWM
jgi:3-oxo-5-alpha-steroid 4-dehydrogenase 1